MTRPAAAPFLALVLLALPALALAQPKPPAPAPGPAPTAAATGASTPTPPPPEVQAALKQADAGDTKPLLKLADGGNHDAQYYAGVMYLFGRPSVPKDPAKGCAYAHKASVKRGDAMHLLARCYQTGANGPADKAKAESAYHAAMEMGFIKSKCALGQMLMADHKTPEYGLDLCRQAGTAGDVEAQMAVGNAYFSGSAVKQDHVLARKWYAMAAQQKNTDAARRLGQMYVRGDGGPKDPKKAMELWTAAEKAGDPLVSILVADQLFSEITGGRTPGPGTYAFKGGVPLADIQVCEEWYQQAQDRDPRPDIKARAKYALKILTGFKAGGTSTKPKTKSKPPPPRPPPPPA
jgi:TPR repeat protein